MFIIYLFNSSIINPNAGMPRVINANAFIAGCINDKPLAIRVGSIAHIERSFLSLCKIFGKYLLGKNIQKPAIYTHKIANSSNNCPIKIKKKYFNYIYHFYIYSNELLTYKRQSSMKICAAESYYHQ